MALIPFPLARPFLFGLDPEHAHDLTLGALAAIQRTPLVALVEQTRVNDPVSIAGLAFPNRIGLAAGLAKNGRCIDAFGARGFGFVEVGTVTPLAQPGNPKPRMFRIPAAGALINRLGFNNDGLAAFIANIGQARFRAGAGGISSRHSEVDAGRQMTLQRVCRLLYRCLQQSSAAPCVPTSFELPCDFSFDCKPLKTHRKAVPARLPP